MFHTDTYFKQAELKMHTNKHTHRGSSCFGWADCPCSCGLQKIPPDIYCSCLVKLNVFGLMSFIYSNWPMALHWFPVSHGEPERQSAHVLCNLWGDYTTRQPTQHTVFVNACICVFVVSVYGLMSVQTVFHQWKWLTFVLLDYESRRPFVRGLQECVRTFWECVREICVFVDSLWWK